MIKFTVRYRTQKWDGRKYLYQEHGRILTFENIEEVTDENINKFFIGWVEILDIKQVVV